MDIYTNVDERAAEIFFDGNISVVAMDNVAREFWGLSGNARAKAVKFIRHDYKETHELQSIVRAILDGDQEIVMCIEFLVLKKEDPRRRRPLCIKLLKVDSWTQYKEDSMPFRWGGRFYFDVESTDDSSDSELSH